MESLYLFIENYNISSLIKTLLFALGLIKVGTYLVDYFYSDFNLNPLEKISFSFSLINILIIVLFYPLILFEYLEIQIVKIAAYIIIFFGIIYLININYNKMYDHIKKNIFIFFILFVFILSSVSPIIDADSINYHTYYPFEFIKKNASYVNEFHFSYYVLGNFISINLLHFSIGALEYSSIIQSLSILFIIMLFYNSDKIKIDRTNYLVIFCLSPLLLSSLITSNKPQLFYSFLLISSVFFFLRFKNKKELNFLKLSLFSISCLYICALGKFYYFILIPLISIWYLFSVRDDLRKIKYIILSNLICFFIILLPYYFWKYNLYQSDLITLLFNPLPNFFGNSIFLEYLQQYTSIKHFPFSLVYPFELKQVTKVFGPIILIFIFHIHYLKRENYLLLVIILSFILKGFFLQTSPRFFLDEYYLYILYLYFTNQPNIKKIIFPKFYKKILYINIILVFFIFTFISFSISTGVITKNLYKDKLKKFAWNYNLYSQLNNLDIDNEKLLLTELSGDLFYRGNSLRYSFHDYLSMSENETYFQKLIEKKPKYILLNGNDESILNTKKKFKGVGFTHLYDFKYYNGTKNPFIKSTEREASLYELNY